jgi:hypothetical protein
MYMLIPSIKQTCILCLPILFLIHDIAELKKYKVLLREYDTNNQYLDRHDEISYHNNRSDKTSFICPG